MTITPPLRPQEDGPAEVDRADVLRQAAPIRTAAFTAIAACVFLLVVTLVGLGQLDRSEPGFLSDALGPEESGAPLERTPAPGVGVRIHSEGYTVTRWGDSVSVVGEDVGGAEWRRHVHGVTRTTEFGAETIIVDGNQTEVFFTVTERQGERTWRWRLATRLVPRLSRDGSVSFLDPTRRRVTGLVVDPVRVLDGNGRDVTPEGLRWDLEDQGSSSWVTLELDDRDLPLPYVIDPAVTYRAAQTATTSGTSIVLDVPAGVQENDLLVALYTIGGNRTIVTPAGWTAAGGSNNGTQVETAAFYRIAGASEPSSYTFTWTGGNEPAAGGMVAHYGVKGTDPLDVIGADQTANSGTVTAPSVTTTAADALVLALFGSATNSTYSTATGMTERFEIRRTGASSAADDMPKATAGATGTKTSSTSASGRNVGHQVAFNVDDVAPTVGQTDPGSPLAGTVALDGTATDQDSAVAQVQFQRSPAGAGTWTNVGAADTTSPYSVSFDTTTVTDGLYDFRAVATDVAGNAGTSTAAANRRIDNTAPSSTTAFPAASTTYSAAGWNGGCGTSGFCGTHSDGAGSGVQSVQVSIRQGAGNYWSGGSFSSGTEVWDAATLAGGNWSYAFAAASFPADGSYTVRVRAVDAAGNIQSPAGRTFTIDTTAPQTTIDSSPADPTSSAGADFTFSASEGGSSFQCRLDGGSWGACASPESYAGLTDGSHTFDVRATDAVGNQDASAATFTWLVDTTAPSSTAGFPTAGGEYNAAGWDAGCATSGLCGTYSDGTGSGVQTVEVSIRRGSANYWDGAAFASASEVWNAATLAGGTWSFAFDSSDFPADGDYTVRVRATDVVANTETPSSRTFAFDTTDPGTTFDFPVAGGSYAGSGWDAGCATSGFCGTHSDGSGSGVASVEISIRRVSGGFYWDGAAFSAGTESFHPAALGGGGWSYGFDSANFPGDGQYTVHVRASDDAGNTETGPARTFRIDNAAPNSTVSFPGAGATVNAAGWDAGCAASGLCGTYSDAGSGVAEVELSIRQGTGDYWDGSAFTSASEVWNTATLAAGDWSYALDSADLAADGDHTIRVRARDAAGNTESASSRTFAYDTAAPSTTIDSTPADPAGTDSASFDFSAGEPASTFECRFDGGAWGACTSPESYAGLADGSHAFDVRATDPAGNTDTTPASFTWLVDTTAPSSTTGFPLDAGSYTAPEWDAGCTVAGLCGTHGDGAGSGVAEVELSIRQGTGDYWDGAAFTSATEVWNDAALAAGDWSYALDSTDFPADGDYTVRVRARDTAGNTESASSRTFAFDSTAPVSTTTFPVAAADYNAAGWDAGCAASGLCGSYTDGTGSGVAEVELSIRQGTGDYWDGAAFAGVPEVWNATSLAGGDWSYAFPASSFPADGDYTIRVRAVDVAGNTETAASRTLTFDTTAPQTTIDSTPADPTGSTGASFDVSGDEPASTFECRLDGGSWTACTSPESYTSLADGSHTFDVRATDPAGSTDATPASFTWLVDTAAPSSTTTFPAAAGEYNAAGWNAGCASSGLCGTYSDGTGSGVQTVEVSIRRGSGDYWDGAAFTSASEVWNTATLAAGDWSYALDSADLPAEGSYTVRVRATDDVGNAETPSSRTFDFDTTDPGALYSFPAAGGEYATGAWNAGCATTGFCGTHSDATSGVAQVEISVQRLSSGLYWDGDSFDAAGETFFATALSGADWSYAFPAAGFPADGQYTVHVRASDDAGNTESGPSRTFRIDDADPTADYGFPASGGTYNVAGWDAGCTTAGLCGTASDGGSGVVQVEISLKRVGADLYWDGDSFDAAGETFFATSFAGGSWSWSFDGADFPADGTYTAHVRASDGAGNTETGPVRAFAIDTAAPQTTIDSSPADPTTSTGANFTFSANEGGSSFECRLDGGAWGACTSPESYAGLADGSHTFDVRATDAAGNVDASPASFTWTVDTADPSSTVDFPAAAGEYSAAGWNAGCATSGLCGTYGDGAAGSGVQSVQVSILRVSTGLSWDGASFSAAGETLFNAGLAGGDWSRAFPASNFPADGSYTVRVFATDTAGNVESPSSRTFGFDDTAPTGSLTAPADGAAVRGAAVTLSSDSADSGAGVASAEFQRRPAGGGAWTPVDTDTTAPYSVAWDTTTLPDGDYDLRAVTTDEAGNAFTSPTRTVTVDNTAPSSAVLDPLPGAIRDGQELTGSAADAGSGVDTVSYLYCEGTSCSPSTPIGSSSTGPGYSVTWSSQPADGDVRVLARVTDRAGNTLDSAVQTVVLDNTSPTGSLTAPADGAAVRGAAVTLSSDSADSGAGVASAEFQRRPAGGGAWTPVDTDTTAPYSVAWDTTTLPDGDYDLRAVTTDEAGNAFTSPTRTVTVDNTAPSVSIVAPTGYVNGGSADPFALAATSPDLDVVDVEIFRCSDASTGCGTGTWVSLGVDAVAPYSASWAIDPDGNRALRALVRDAAGNTGTDVVDVTVDRTDPAGALTAPADGAFAAAAVAVSSDSADGGSGVDSAAFEQRPSGGGAWTPIGSDATAPYSVSWDTTAVTDGDYDLRVVTTDMAGNAFTSAVRTVTVDNSAPSTPVVTLTESSPFAHVTGTEIFVNTAQTGTYDVDATSADPHSGIDRVRFPGPADDSTSPYGASYDLDDLAGTQTVTAYNGVDLTASSPFTVTPDTAGPAGGSVSYPDGYDADGDVAVTVDAGTDALAGVAPASAVLERRTAPLADGSCDPFAGAWDPVTSPDTVASSLCAQYRYRVSDRVGNETVYASGDVVKVDLAAPSAPALTLTESSAFAHVVGTEIFLNTAETGSYDVEAAAVDPVSGIEKVAFPGGIDDTGAPFVQSYDFDDLSGTQTVTAHDRAGNTAGSDFLAREDVSAPSTTDDTAAIGSAWQSAPVTVTLTPTDARSGVAATYYTTDGSMPTTASAEGTSIDLTADGVYTIRYFSVDNVGNVEPVRTAFDDIRIDRTNPAAPSITLSESSPFAHVSGDEIFVNTGQAGTYDVEATSSDAGSGLEKLAFPGGVDDTTSPYAASYAFGDLTGGQTVTAHDVAGNTASDTFTVTPDTAAPAGGFVSYPDGYDADGVVTVTVDPGSDALAGLDAGSAALERQTTPLAAGACDPFAGGWSAVTSPDTVPADTCARYRYRVSDRVGNEAAYTSGDVVKVDPTAPQTTIDAAPTDPSSDASPSFQFSASEAGSTFDCRLDGGAWTACTSPESLAGLADGSHTFDVRATDASGNPDLTPASHTWTVDTDAPETTLDSAPADPSTEDTPSFAFSADEAGATFECRLDGGAWTACTSPEPAGPLADGPHTFDVRAADEAGNSDGTPAQHAWTVDTTAPETTLDATPSDPSNDPAPAFAFSADEPGSTFECRVDGGSWTPCASPLSIGPLADGPHAFDVRATDPAGNTDGTPAQHAWDVNAVAPTVAIVQPSGFVNAADADPYTVRATSPDGDLTGVELFRCSDASTACATGSWVSLGTDATPPYEASWPLDADGPRALRAVATDAGSNTGQDVVTVTIDRSVPATTIDSAPSDPSASATADFAFSANDGGATFECRLDGGSWTPCASPESYAGLADGGHTFSVRAADAAGNVEATPASFAWTVDTAAPETTIDTAPSDPSSSSSPSFEFSSNEAGSTFECRLDGGGWTACTSPESLAGLADGSHTFDVRATDTSGTTDPTPASHTWTVDATPPGGGLADPGQYLRGTVALGASPTDTGVGVQSVDFQLSPADAGTWTSIDVDTSDPYGLSWDTTGEADGLYDLRVVVTDNAGNVTPSAVVEDRVVDNTAPGATMDDPGAYLRATVALTSTTSDGGSGVASVAYERSAAGAGSWTPAAASWDTTAVADGFYDLRVVVTDNAGNSTTSAPIGGRRVDNTRPSIASSGPADGSTVAAAGSLAVVAGEDVTGIANAEIDGAPAPAPTVAGDTVTFTSAFANGAHTLSGELEDLAGNRQPIRVHFTVWTGASADYPYVEKNSFSGTTVALRTASDTATLTVPSGAWSGAPVGDWLVVRLDPQPATGLAAGFQSASEAIDVTAYWALSGTSVTSFALPLEIEIDNALDGVIPATYENGAWRGIEAVPGTGLPAAWSDGFERDGTNVRILTRHLTQFTLLQDVQAPTEPGGFKGTRTGKSFRLAWSASSDNSGLISAYRVLANGAVVKTVAGSALSTTMGTFKPSEKRAFQVAAVDEAGNASAKSYALRAVPKVTKLKPAAAKQALKKRGFKVGKVTYKRSKTIPKGKTIAAGATGLRRVGTKIALSVSKGRAAARRPVTSTPVAAPPAAPPSSPAPAASVAPPPGAAPPAAPAPAAPAAPAADGETEPSGGGGPFALPFDRVRSTSLSELRQELGFGLLVAAFSIGFTAVLRARRPLGQADGADEELLWDARLLRSVGRFLRRLSGRP